jgi:cobalt-zinc-cadmium efflux system membrane fusion protein
MKKMVTILLVSTATCLLITSCQTNNSAAEKPDDKVCISDSMAKIIRIDMAGESQINDEVKLTGEVSFNDNKVVKVYPFSSGQISKVMVSLGDKVGRGQTLAIIKSADVAGNYSDLSAANNDVSIAKKQMDNAEALYKNGIASEKEYMEAKENYSKAMSNANKIQNQIAINGGGQTSANGIYVVKAPIGGYVVEKNAEQGSFIRTDNTQNLFTVGDIKDVWIWANVYETDVAKVKEGYTATVTTLAYPDKVFTGKVDKVNEILDPQTKVMKVRIALNNAGLLLKPEMFANILIQNKEIKEMITIPASAIVSDNGKSYVVIYHDKCNLELRQVDVLKTVSDKAYIRSGMQKGEKVISQNQILLYRALIEE